MFLSSHKSVCSKVEGSGHRLSVVGLGFGGFGCFGGWIRDLGSYCVYLYIYIYTYIYTHTHIYIYTYKYVYIYIYIYIYISVNAGASNPWPGFN